MLAPVRAGTRVEALTSDRAWVRAMLDAEAALARAQARAGLISGEAAALIDRTAAALTVDAADLARRSRQSAGPVVPLVTDLRAAVSRAGGEDVARLVHLGATTQDILDTAAMLVATRAVAVITADLDAALALVADLAQRHRTTVMAARTLGQHAVPTTFGLKAAGWLTGLLRTRDRLRALPLPAQLGGAAGTLAALVEATRSEAARSEAAREAARGEAVRGEAAGDASLRVLALVGVYAEELGLAMPLAPWHAERSVIGELGAALSGTARALGKPATDVILMAQTEVGEVAESSQGGSSAMPHKRNPALSVLIRSASFQVPAYAQALAQVGEHERAAGAWQAEWAPLRECLRLTGGAAETAVELVGGLRVFPDRMRANVELTGGRTVSERLAAHLDRDDLRAILDRDGPLDVPPDALDQDAPQDLLDPAGYLGAAPELVDRILAAYRARS
ncbi:3-carboxy-cis,cis-muconate cycloisomerase [Nonomuraea glycinis]|uniref:3-carboxy-cis,cis-muconate cycloisomerase n=1 Tax=Nonomuraea glycinis TaxID=2047744 RepID=A0A918AEI7_9ACTN|nr:3-carboxy-cis,cis-muconate cycloisomerase [Nonomuraea glycinis]